MKSNNIQFKQSLFDFPLTVGLGRKTPIWGLTRWKENRGLRFIPFDDEGFSLRGDKRQLLYKGNRQSHRFTILNDGAFEYDCILNKEPESNTISLRMEGAEYFDFFRQPDFVCDPFLKGSYAVYLKDTFVGQGTGKLCHIHRPLIIDSLGRKCWGVLSVVGDELRITIPQEWLSNAKYPVIVDPTVGTTTVGSQTVANFQHPITGLYTYLQNSIMANKYLLPEQLNGAATAYVYVYSSSSSGACKPIFYSDDNDKPLTRRSQNEGSLNVTVNGSNPEGWRTVVLNSNTNIPSGSYLWFGLTAAAFHIRFDFGLKAYWYMTSMGAYTPSTFPTYPDNRYFDCKLSAYFIHQNAQNYSRTLTQGVSLSDLNIQKADYKKKFEDSIIISSNFDYLKLMIKKLSDTVNNFDTIKHIKTYFRGIYEEAKIIAEARKQYSYFSVIQDNVNAEGITFRSFIIFVKLMITCGIKDFIINRFLIAKEQIILKSCISREIVFESKIN